jgi:outer membrane receptor protein involved in Fe transport
MAAPARVAAALFADVPFTGQVNLLTSSTVDSPEQLLSDATFARGLAYVSVGAAAGQQGDWAVQAAMTQGDVASWMVAGSFFARQRASHRYEAGMSYAEQRYTGTNAASLAAVADGSRSAGSVFAYDTWTLSRHASLEYGGRYARYGYIARALFSPRASLEVTPVDRVRVRVSASRREEAPGADELAPSAMSTDWLPLQRTFTPLAGERFRPERTETYEVALSHDLSGTAVLGLRTFYQRTEDQVATLFGLGLERTTADVDHYSVASAGDFEARGWSVSVTRVVGGRLRGSVDYTVTTAHWQPSSQTATLAALAPSLVRIGSERFHDLTTSLETEIPYTATRVFALYRVNTAFAGDALEQLEASPAARFDVQVTQSLPFLDFTSAQWEMLFGIRNMVRELVADGSVYDELLVVRPPKRVVGGLTVRF